MPIVTNAVLDGLRTNFEGLFAQVFKNTPTWYDRLCTTIPSNSKSNTYGWLMNSFAMREWVGPRVVQNMQEHEWAIYNKLWEMTADLKRTDVEDDNLGVFAAATMPNLALSAKKHPDIRTALVLQAAKNTACFDGTNFFSATHPNFILPPNGVAGTYSNYFSSGDSTATPLDADGVNTIRSKMASYIGENGYPLGVVPNLLIVPPQLEKAALTVAHSTTYAMPTVAGSSITPTAAMATVTNVMKGWFDVLVLPELANEATTWYMADVTKPLKPLVYQPRVAPELIARFNPQDPAVFNLDRYTWGVRARYEVGFSLPYLMSRVEST